MLPKENNPQNSIIMIMSMDKEEPMMIRKIAALLFVLVLCLGTVQVTAENYTYYSSVWAKANNKLATRTGPGTQYDEPGTFNTAGEYRILSKAYDGNIWWLQVEIRTNKGTIWAYTGLKRFNNVDLNRIPEEKVIGRCKTAFDMTGYYSPVMSDEYAIRQIVPGGVQCNIYGYYNDPYDDGGNGEGGCDYIQIEFYDPNTRQYRRAWVPDPFVDDYEMYYGW